MDKEKYLAGVTELYQGEVEGEGLFSTLLGTCPAEHAYGVALLLQLESEAKARLRPFLWYAEFQAAGNAKAAIEEVLDPLERSWTPQ